MAYEISKANFWGVGGDSYDDEFVYFDKVLEMSERILNVRELTLRYPTSEKPVIDKISFDVEVDERVALIGANGAGKTTLMLSLVGIVPHTGVIEWKGIRLERKTAAQIRREIGFVFQTPDEQLFSPTIRDDLAFGLENMGCSEAEIREHVEEWLSRFKLEAFADRSAHALSGGEKRMAALAAVLCMSPKLLLLDEPTAFLDACSRRRLESALLDLPQARIISTHDIGFAYRMCSRAILLRDGHMVADGPCETLFRDRALMASCGADWLD